MDYVIGDIHGCNKTLNALLERIGPTEEDNLIFLGDYIDRGPDSKGVIQTLIDIKTPKTLLLGNHEDMLLSFFINGDESAFTMWMYNGGKATFDSYNGVIDKDHLSFLRKECGLILENDKGFYITHAGIDPANPMECNRNYYLWDRGSSPPMNVNKKLIVGHTIKTLKEIRKSLSTRKIYLDNGCFTSGVEGYGNLVALCLDTMQLIIQPNIEKE